MKWAVVTGASSGLGADFARSLASSGWPLCLIARRRHLLEELKSECLQQGSSQVLVLDMDLSDESSRNDLLQEMQSRPIELLINNAGFGAAGSFLKLPWERQSSMIQLNMEALAHLCHGFGNLMLPQKSGTILNVASVAAFQPGPSMATYFASKAFVLHLSEALHRELQSEGIQVCCLCPGTTRTEFFDSAGAGHVLRASPSMDSAEVVRLALRGVHRRQGLIVTGALNRILSFLPRCFPRALTTRICGWILNRR